MADISQWPKDDDLANHISNLQSRLEQQVENSADHFIFRISDDEYAALSVPSARHMAKFRELVDIYCGKTLKLYRVCEGCGFASFMRRDMVEHFKNGTCALRFFNALGTCDDDDPNREVEEEEEVEGGVAEGGVVEEITLNDAAVTEVTPEMDAIMSNEGLKAEVTSDVEEDEPKVIETALNDDQLTEVTPETDEVTSSEDLKVEVTSDVEEDTLNVDQITEVTTVTDEIASNDILKMEISYEATEIALNDVQITEVTPETDEVTSNDGLKVKVTSVKKEVEDDIMDATPNASDLEVTLSENHVTNLTPDANEDVSNHADLAEATAVKLPNLKRKKSRPKTKKISETKERYQCPLCKSEMALENKYNHFRRYCPVKFENKYPCYHCQLLFDNLGDVRRHIRDVHNPNFKASPARKPAKPKIVKPPKPKKTENRYQCPLCKLDIDKVSKYNHINRHCPVKFGNKKPCYHCPMVFDKIIEVRQHIKTAHNSTNNLEKRKCKDCDTQFKSLSGLKLHLRSGCPMLKGPPEVKVYTIPKVPTDSSTNAPEKKSIQTSTKTSTSAPTNAPIIVPANPIPKASLKMQCKDCLAFFPAPDLVRHQQNYCQKTPLDVSALTQPTRKAKAKANRMQVKPAQQVMVMGPLEFIQCDRCQIFCISPLELARHKAEFCRRGAGQQQETIPPTVECATEEELERHRREDCKDAAPLESVIKVEETKLDGDVGRNVEEDKT